MRARALVVLGAALVTGCSLIYAGDLDGLHEIVVFAEASSADGSSGSSAGGASEAGVIDTGTPDGQISEAAAPQGCAAYQPAPKFCADFDNDAGLAGWNINTGDGTSVVSTEQSFSAPSAAKVTTTSTAQDCLYSRFEREFLGIGTKRVSAKFRMRLQSPWPDGMIPFVFDIHAPGPGDTPYCAALFFINAPTGKVESAFIDVQSSSMPNHDQALNGYPSTDEWTEIEVTITPNPSGGLTYETTFIDPNGFSVSNRQDFAECPNWGRAAVHFGSHCDHRDSTVFFDDIRVDWE